MAKSIQSSDLIESSLQTSHSATWRDYYELTKPKVVMLLLLTALVGMCLATPSWINPVTLVAGLVGIGFLSSAAAVINHVVDRNIDRKMARTLNRPVAKGKVSIHQALWFAAALTIIGSACLLIWVNLLTTLLTLTSLVGYAVIYTMFLKRATPQNIVIGGLAGAAPPLLGWTAVTNHIHADALLLVLIIFTWTPPHFWALAIHRKNDYAKANVPMLPVTHGIEFTKTSVLLYTILLCVIGVMPFLTGMSSYVYLLGSSVLNLMFVGYAVQLKFFSKVDSAIKTFKFSIIHLMLLFIVLLMDHYLM